MKEEEVDTKQHEEEEGKGGGGQSGAWGGQGASSFFTLYSFTNLFSDIFNAVSKSF